MESAAAFVIGSVPGGGRMKRRDSRVRILRVFVAALSLVALASGAEAKHRRKKQTTAKPRAGAFDYYVVALSWSPEHCAEPAGRSDKLQCHSKRRFAFVLHGLWPQFEKGYPQQCSTAPLEPAVRDSMLEVMPSTKLVHHEWSKHGTCSGLSPEGYFARARSAFTSVRIPPTYQSPENAFTTDVSGVEQAFREVNAALQPEGIAVRCRGRFLQEVRVCLTRDLQPRACGQDVKDYCRGESTVRPVR